MIKLVVSDLDGTMMPYGEHTVKYEIKKAIHRIIESGAVFAVSSGRDFGDLMMLFPEFEEKIYFICADGAYYVKSDRILYNRPITKEALKDAEMQVGSSAILLHGKDNCFCIGDGGLIPSDLRVQNIKFIKSTKDLQKQTQIFKITKFSSPLRLSKTSSLRLHWDGRDLGRYEYLNRFCNKGASLSHLQTTLMISPFDTAVIGDGDNDVPLFKQGRIKIAVGDHSKELSTCRSHKAASFLEAASLLDLGL